MARFRAVEELRRLKTNLEKLLASGDGEGEENQERFQQVEKRQRELISLNHAFVDDLQAAVFNHLILVRHASFDLSVKVQGSIDKLNTLSKLDTWRTLGALADEAFSPMSRAWARMVRGSHASIDPVLPVTQTESGELDTGQAHCSEDCISKNPASQTNSGLAGIAPSRMNAAVRGALLWPPQDHPIQRADGAPSDAAMYTLYLCSIA